MTKINIEIILKFFKMLSNLFIKKSLIFCINNGILKDTDVLSLGEFKLGKNIIIRSCQINITSKDISANALVQSGKFIDCSFVGVSGVSGERRFVSKIIKRRQGLLSLAKFKQSDVNQTFIEYLWTDRRKRSFIYNYGEKILYEFLSMFNKFKHQKKGDQGIVISRKESVEDEIKITIIAEQEYYYNEVKIIELGKYGIGRIGLNIFNAIGKHRGKINDI